MNTLSERLLAASKSTRELVLRQDLADAARIVADYQRCPVRHLCFREEIAKLGYELGETK